jgi:formylglycine-generating enzyme required for sulfatase activity
LLEQREKIARPEFVNFEFPCGKQWLPPNDAGNYAGPRRRRATLPVGSFKPNSMRLFGLGGNVWEWCPVTYKGDNSATGRDWRVCCAAAPGLQVIASKCNPLTET